MKKLPRKKIVTAAVLSCLALLGSCTQSTTPIDANGSNVAMRTEPDNSIIHSSGQTASENAAGNVDSLQVTSAAFVASNFALRNDISDDQPAQNLNEVFFRTAQFLLAFDGSGMQYIGEVIVPAGTYNRARFDTHPLQGISDSLRTALGPLTPSLLAGASGNSTIIIHGYIWQSGEKLPFIYNSSNTGNGNILFKQPLVVTAGSPMEVLVRFSSQSAFMDGTGVILDPRDGRNAAAIETNLKDALKASVNTTGN